MGERRRGGKRDPREAGWRETRRAEAFAQPRGQGARRPVASPPSSFRQLGGRRGRAGHCPPRTRRTSRALKRQGEFRGALREAAPRASRARAAFADAPRREGVPGRGACSRGSRARPAGLGPRLCTWLRPRGAPGCGQRAPREGPEGEASASAGCQPRAPRAGPRGPGEPEACLPCTRSPPGSREAEDVCPLPPCGADNTQTPRPHLSALVKKPFSAVVCFNISCPFLGSF